MNYRVYYKKNPTFHSDPNLTMENFLDTHTHVENVNAKSLDDVYMMMQGEVWSPNGEKRNLIKSLGLNHTSLSVGDVVRCVENGKLVAYECDSFGWREI